MMKKLSFAALVALGVAGAAQAQVQITGGSTGENYGETVEERTLIVRFMIERVQDRIPVFVGTGALRTLAKLYGV